jgi:hypothetical protein
MPDQGFRNDVTSRVATPPDSALSGGGGKDFIFLDCETIAAFLRAEGMHFEAPNR